MVVDSFDTDVLKRKAFYEYVERRAKLIHDEFVVAERELIDSVVKSERKRKLTLVTMAALILMIKQSFTSLRKNVHKIIIGSFLSAAKNGVLDSIRDAESFGNNRLKLAADASFATVAASYVKKFKLGDIPLSRRIWDVTWSTQKRIQQEVHLAVMRGESAAILARRLKGFMGIPKTSSGGVLAQIIPTPGMYKSVYKNALRLARTEINRAYVNGVYQYGQSKNWVDGYVWRVASGDPCEECLDEDGKFFPKDDPPDIPLHPHCMCYPEIHYANETHN